MSRDHSEKTWRIVIGPEHKPGPRKGSKQRGGVTPRPMLERLMGKILKSTDDGCWRWTAAVDKFGYGRLSTPKTGPKRAHRVAFELLVGPIPRGQCVLHHCDNPGCVNPAHLFLGTRDDNNRDMRAKRRDARGSRMPHAKLTADVVKRLRDAYATGTVSQAELGRRFGVSQSVVSETVRGRAWR